MKKYVFLIGAPDDRKAIIAGFDAAKKIAYTWDGHTEFTSYLQVPEAEKEYWYLLPFTQDRFNISVPKIIINCIANPDIVKDGLHMAQNILRDVQTTWPGVPIFNSPAGILMTARDEIYTRFQALPDLEIPKTIRIKPLRVQDVIMQAGEHGFNFPYIVRQCGAHGGDRLVLMTKPDDADALERFAYDGQDYYITQFRDYKNADGYFVKTRLIMMGDEIYPRHAIISDGWAVHAKSRSFMMGRADLKQREAEILEGWQSMIAPSALLSLKTIQQTLGLDYVGIDGCILPDGRLLVFEINASQYAMAPSDYAAFPYLKKYVENIIIGFNQLISARVGNSTHA